MKKQTTRCQTLQSPQVRTLLLRHDRTTAEEQFIVWLLLFLDELGFSGEIHCRCFLANPSGKLRRPDIYIPRYALPIEIDGCTRDSWQIRVDDRTLRDDFYTSLGAHPPLIVPATWLASDLKMDRLKRELRKHLFIDRASKPKVGLINKKICEGRKKAEANNPGLFQSNGSIAPQFLDELKLRGFKEYRHFGGTRFVLRGKYKKQGKIPHIDFKYLQSDEYGEVLQKMLEDRFSQIK